MNAKHSPKKVTLAMIKGKPIATSVPVIHYRANNDELEEFYPSTDEEKRLTPEFEKISADVASSGSSRCTERKSMNELDVTESSSENRSIGADSALPEGGTPPLGQWKMFSELKGMISKAFEELSDIKSEKRKQSYSRAESSSISDSEEQGSTTLGEEKTGEKQVTEQPAVAVVRQRSNPVRYVAFSGVKTGLKDKSLDDESVESGVEASEFSQDVNDEVVPRSNDDIPKAESTGNTARTVTNSSPLQHSPPVRSTTLSKKTNFKTIFFYLAKQLICQAMFRSIAVFIGIFCVYYVVSIPQYLLGFIVGIFATVTVYDTLSKLKEILTTLPDETFASKSVIRVLKIPAVEEHVVVERFQGWLNELPCRYEPSSYRVARTKSVFFRLEGSTLRVMETRMKIPKKAVWDEPKHKLKFTKRRVYDLTEAKVDLLPHGLTRRRRWSKKYPICITVKREALIANDSKKRIKCESNKKCATKWEEASNDHGTWFVEAEDDDEPSTLERNEEQEEEEEDDEGEYEDDYLDYDDDDDDDDDDERESSNNDDLNGEYVEYNGVHAENEEAKKCTEKEEVGKKKEDGKVTDRIRRNAKKDRSGYRYKKDKYEKKCREVLKGIQFKKRRSNVGKESNMKGESEQERKKDRRKMLTEEEEEKEEVDDDEDDEDDDDDEDEDNCSYFNRDDDKEETRMEDEVVFASVEDDEEEAEGGENLDREEEREDWETIDGSSQSKSLRSSSKKCGGERNNELKLFVFGRTDREKEDWYRRLISAATHRGKPKDSSSFSTDASSPSTSTNAASATESKSCVSSVNSFESVPELNYNAYMAKYLDIDSSSTSESNFSVNTDNTLWINCLIARILFDVHKCPETINLIQDKIQRKLSSIKLPYFMECLLVSEVAIGQGAPIIRNVSKPVTNERGLWLDLDVTYKGSLTMTVETKLNLMKLKKTSESVSGSVANSIAIPAEKRESLARSPIFDSDVEDTPESSTEDDDDATPPGTQMSNTAKETRRKLLSMVDRIAANKYFQHATELSYVRRAMEGVSNTEIRLMVTVSSIEGCLSVNIPPAPSDRLWYGFKSVPKITLTVKSAVGERTVNIVYVTKWIEAKLLREFEKLVVLPNMDDLVLPLCPNYPYVTTR